MGDTVVLENAAMRREANPTDHEHTRKRRRGRAFVLALLWFFGWTAATIQPCCEALAAVIPHHPETGTAAAHAQHDHPARDDNGPASEDHHSHCPNATPADLNTPAPVASTGGSYRIQTPLYLPASRVAPVPLTPQPTVLRLRYRPPPPILPPPFLVQRLMI